jgi:hypothetical protein
MAMTTTTNDSSSTTFIVPCVLRYRKPGRGAVDAFKLVWVHGEVVLAQPVRHRTGAAECVSIPLPVLTAARRAGATAYVWRHDRLGIARRLPLAEAERRAITVRDGELYFKLADLEPVPPPSWPFTDAIVEVSPPDAAGPGGERQQRGEGQQLSLFDLSGEVRR